MRDHNDFFQIHIQRRKPVCDGLFPLVTRAAVNLGDDQRRVLDFRRHKPDRATSGIAGGGKIALRNGVRDNLDRRHHAPRCHLLERRNRGQCDHRVHGVQRFKRAHIQLRHPRPIGQQVHAAGKGARHRQMGMRRQHRLRHLCRGGVFIHIP